MGIKREYHKWFSPNLQREMELLVFGHAGARVLVFPTRCGRFFEFEDRGMIESVEAVVRNGWLQFFCVDSLDMESLYAEWRPARERIRRHVQYQQYIMHEVVPFTERKNPGSYFILHGSSLGAYHAVNLGFRFPARFNKIVAFSGRFDLTKRMQEFNDLFEGYYDEDVYYNNPSHFVPPLADENLLGHLRKLEMVFVIGDSDPFYQNNCEFSRILWDKGIWHAFHSWNGRAHKWKYWRQMIRIYL